MNKVYFSRLNGVLSVLNGNTNIATGLPASLGFNLKGFVNKTLNRVYLLNSSGVLNILDGSSDTLIASTTTNALQITDVVFNEATGRIYVSDSISHSVKVLDENGSVVGTLPVSDGVLGINNVTNRLYVATTNDKNFYAVGLQSNVVSPALQLSYTPNRMDVDAATSRIYVSSGSRQPQTGISIISDSIEMSLSSNNLSFTDQPVGILSNEKSITVTSSGGRSMQVSGVVPAGDNPADFVITSDTCTGATLVLNATCNVKVKFAPTATGNRSASLIFNTNVTSTPQSVAMSGSGIVMTISPTGSNTGNVAVQSIEPASAPTAPDGFAISDSIAYDITPPAGSVSGQPVTVAFAIPSPISEADFNKLSILHNENGVLVDVTADRQGGAGPARVYNAAQQSGTIYAVTTSFSPFYLAKQAPYRISASFDETKAKNSGSTIPVKLDVLNSTGSNVSSSSLIVSARNLWRQGGTASYPATDAGNANPGGNFRYTGGRYTFNLKTTGLPPGAYSFSFYVGNDRSFFYVVKFEIK